MTRQQKYPDTSTFHYVNVNPKGRITSDCVVRALTTATGLNYNGILFALVAMQLETGYSVASKENYDRLLQRMGWKRMRQPRKPNGRKYTGAEFCKAQQRGTEKDGIVISPRIVANIGGEHVVAIVDGRVNDIWNSTDGCIGNYWYK